MSKKKTATETMMEEAEKLRKNCLVSLDARLNRIERRLNLTGTADPYTCCVCGQPAVGGHGTALGARIGYCRLHWPDNTTRTVGECICTHRMLPDPDCPLHGWVTIFKGQKAAYDRLHKTPDLPLNAKVAKALGLQPYKNANGWFDGGGHIFPDYPNDLVAAWEAFRTYLEQNDLMWKIERTHTGQGYIGLREIHAGWDISKEGDKVVMYHLRGKTLAENFCEAIVKHAEQQ